MADREYDIVLAFLRTPSGREAFGGFFDLTWRLTAAHLRGLRYRGFQLPVDDRTDADPLSDLAIDVLGVILAPVDGLPCPGLFRYLRKQGIDEFRVEDGKFIYLLYTAFLRRQIGQQVHRLFKDRSPQVENLKRRIKDITDGPSFCRRDDSATGHTIIGLSGCEPRPAVGVPPVGRDELRRVVLRAFNGTTTRESWCLEIFRLLAEDGTPAPAVYRHDLLALMVEVNARFLDGEEFGPSHLLGPQATLVAKTIDAARCRVVADTYDSVVQRFVQSGQITPEEGVAFRTALDLYLTDLAASDGHDKLPAYFREVLPDAYPRYLADYKYVFETTLNKGKDRLQEIISADPTIRSFGDYPIVGE